MANFNAVMVMGRLVRDPELLYSQNGIPLCRLRLASNKKFKKADGTAGESTVFVDVTAWRRLAEICSQFLKKGREIFVSGELVQSNWVDKEGQKRSRLRITAGTVQFIGTPKDGNGNGEVAEESAAAEEAEVPPE